MSKNKKELHKDIYRRTIETYTYSSNYNPKDECVIDTLGDYYDLYGTKYPKYDSMFYNEKFK